MKCQEVHGVNFWFVIKLVTNHALQLGQYTAITRFMSQSCVIQSTECAANILHQIQMDCGVTRLL